MVSRVLDALRGLGTGISGGSNEVLEQTKELEKMYSKRQENFSKWYRLLSLEDELKQNQMESFVGNDPRTTWNMSNFLLQPKPLVHRILNEDGTPLLPLQRDAAAIIETYFHQVWKAIDSQDIRRGRQSWFWSMIGFMLATGWYALPHLTMPNGKLFVDYWNPAQVFPEFGERDEGMVRLGRVRAITARQAVRISRREGWLEPNEKNGTVIESQLWLKMGNQIFHGVSFNNKLVKPITLTIFSDSIPVLVGATGGIPNTIDKVDEYYAFEEGQSILATNEHIYKNMNKQSTFMQQLLRDTANPRVFQTVTGNRKIINNPEEWYARGAFFEGGPNDRIDVIPMPAIPVELTNLLFQLRNQAQRGSFSDLAFGNVIQEVSSIILSQAADSARQLLFPFHMAVQFITSEITTNWYKTLLDNPGLRPNSWPEITPGLLDNTRVFSNYHISIPGDLANRVQIAKQISPNLEAPVKDTLELLIPEIPDITGAMARLDADKARQHPSYVLIQVINGFEAAAGEAERANDTSLARLFRSAASNLRQQLTGQPGAADRLGENGQQSPASGVLPDGPRPNMPRQRLG